MAGREAFQHKTSQQFIFFDGKQTAAGITESKITGKSNTNPLVPMLRL